MSDPSKETARIQFLLTILGLLMIFTLIVLLALLVYPYVFAPPNAVATAQARDIQPTRSSTPSPNPSLTPSPSHTLRNTFTPTISLTPTRTPTPTLTPTPPGPPTLTPARPVIGENNYLLQDWSPEQMEFAIALMEDYPNTLPRQSRGPNDENYYAAYEFAVIAQREALLRYPQVSQADSWSWELAYNLARLGDARAGEQYASLIEQALNREQAEVDDLAAWVRTRSPLLEIIVHQIPSVPGYLSSYVLELQAEGSAFILLHETLSAFQASVLTSDFDFVNQPHYDLLTGDLTGDGLSEVAIIRRPSPGEHELTPPRVFSLAEDNPPELPFHPDTRKFNHIGTNFVSQWEIMQGETKLKFTGQAFPSCPLTLSLTYIWDGSWFVSDGPDYMITPPAGTLSYCRYVIEHAVYSWGPQATATLMESLIPIWPPTLDENGTPYPEDEMDSWRYRLAINHALAGHDEQARTYLEEIILNPSTPTSRWVAFAQQFLADYRLENGLYRACLASEACQPSEALQYLIEQMPVSDYPTILSHLWQLGITQRSSGYFDFDGDGSNEIWLTVRHRPAEPLEFWFLIPAKDGIRAFNLGTTDSAQPHVTYYAESSLPPVIWIPDFQAFQVYRLPDSLEPYLTYVELPQFYPDRFKEGLEAQVEALFAGTNPATVEQALLGLQDHPGLLCRGTWSCDRYYYILGLSAELAGDRSTAIDTYLTLWWDYSRSPYTTMARLKLKGAFAPPTATSSLTPTASQIPAFTTTLTITGTPPTSTATPTNTITSEPYPYPPGGPTATFGPTATYPGP